MSFYKLRESHRRFLLPTRNHIQSTPKPSTQLTAVPELPVVKPKVRLVVRSKVSSNDVATYVSLSSVPQRLGAGAPAGVARALGGSPPQRVVSKDTVPAPTSIGCAEKNGSSHILHLETSNHRGI